MLSLLAVVTMSAMLSGPAGQRLADATTKLITQARVSLACPTPDGITPAMRNFSRYRPVPTQRSKGW